MSQNRLTVIIPSRSQPDQTFFLRRSVRSIRKQVVADQFQITIMVAVDKGELLDADFCNELGIVCVESDGKSQAAALNAAIRRLDCDYVAILEDDDRWQPFYLEVAQKVLKLAGFVSSNQILFDQDGDILRYLDFPTPSGWIMHYETMARIGEFNEAFRYHIDNDWLGRLNQSGIERVHLLEKFAEQDLQLLCQERDQIRLLMAATQFKCTLIRHRFPYPLVQRYAHDNSGMAQIMQFDENRQVSIEEYGRLDAQFGCIPS